MFAGTLKLLVLFVACITLGPQVLAATLTSGTDEFVVRHWTTEDGLPQSYVSALAQTPDGYIWIGSWSGLARFDGVRFVRFDKFNTPALRSDAVNVLEVDRQGALWIGTSDGLLRFHKGRLLRFGKEEGLPYNTIFHLKASRSGGLWVYTGGPPGSGGLAYLENEKVKWTRTDIEDSSRGALRRFLGESNGVLEILLDGGVIKVDANTIEKVTPAGLGTIGFRSALLDERGQVAVIGSGKEVLVRAGDGWQSVAPGDSDQGFFNYVFRDRWNNLWCSSRKQTWRIQERKGIPVTWLGKDRFSLTCAVEDSEGGLWFGTDTGLILLRHKLFRTYTEHDGLPADQVWSVQQGQSGRIWLGTEAGSAVLEGDRITPIQGSDRGRAVWETRSGCTLAARVNDLALFTNQSMAKLFKPALLGGSGARTLYEDRQGRMWIGLDEGAAVLPETCSEAGVIGCRSFPFGSVRSILEDRSGVFWFGTAGQGLARLEPRNKTASAADNTATSSRQELLDGCKTLFQTRNGLPSDNIWAIYQDRDGVLWLGSENGLSRYAGDRFFNFTHVHGLREGVVNQILEDDHGYFWLSGLRGIYRVSRQELNAIADGKLALATVAAFGLADGMESSETNGEGQPAGWKTSDGRLWFPTTRGVVVIDPAQLKIEQEPAQPILEEVKAGSAVMYANTLAGEGAFTSEAKPHRLQPDQGRFVEFRFTVPNFVSAQRVSFLYRLTGYEQEWNEPLQERVARYTNLRPGAYTFQLKARNHHGLWCERPASFAFVLAPHFYETWPFYAGCALVLVALARAVQTYRLRVQSRILRLDHQQTLERERVRIARDLHDDLGASLTGIALQLEAARSRGKAGDGQLHALAEEARSLTHELRELAWTTNPRCDNASSLAAFAGDLAERFCRAAGLECRLQLPPLEADVPIPARMRYELVMVLKESLANVSKHAQARSVTVGLDMSQSAVRLTIRDDGQGFDSTRANAGSGFRNIRERIEQAGGTVIIESKPGAGTLVTATLPLENRDP